MKRVIAAPGRYIQYAGAWEDITAYCEEFAAERILIAADAFSEKRYLEEIVRKLRNKDFTVEIFTFLGDCSQENITACAMACSNAQAGLILGLGGGRATDLAKAAAHYLHKPVILLPTAASSDGVCSGQVVIESGEGVKYLRLYKSADMVLVDLNVMIDAPASLLINGIGDAISTCVECTACYQAKGETPAGGMSNEAALTLSYLCQNTLLQFGAQAVQDCEAKRITPEFEKVVQAVLYLSAIGYESGGLSLAHQIAYAMARSPQTAKIAHGQLAAFGALAQLNLMGSKPRDLCGIMELCDEIGLPYSLSCFDISGDQRIFAREIADEVLRHPEELHLACEVTREKLVEAICE